MIADKLTKPYDPLETESRIYKLWDESGFFNPDVCIEKGNTKADAPTFSMVLPPPNITGRLHLGHALEHSIQDSMIRFERMRGKRTLWIPGTDHAAIATQSRFEKELYAKEKKSRHDFSREEFFNMVHDFGLNNQKEMQRQMRMLGSSLDWSREAFTLDEKRSLAVRTAFKQMFDEDLIYRGNRVVNWDPKGQTTISDAEIVHEERKAILYTFKYSKDFPIAISTTRPETKVGDTAVAVHPDDSRYKEFVGKEYTFDFCNVPVTVKIIADKEADPEFGTGALGVTPAHSKIDFMMAERHNLPVKQVINEYAKMTVGDENLLNKKTTEARQVIVDWLKAEGLMIEEKEILQNVGTAERTGGIVEPLPKLQWFINVNKPIPSRGNKTFKDLMREPIEDGRIEILPERFKKMYLNWVNDLYDWCISRQILYGHQIPVWYKFKNGLQGKNIAIGPKAIEGNLAEWHCDIIDPEKAGKGPLQKDSNVINSESWTQDPDTLDTWFSSGLWTFTTLGWPEKTKDLETYHPTTLMDPGYEILFLWVSRMVMMSQYFLGEIPFKTVYVHGIVRDKTGQKFSKSLKNGVEPEEVIAKYGTDALRMSMLVGNGPGSDISFDIQKIKAYRNFSNKLWNISRFILESATDEHSGFDFENWTEIDRELKVVFENMLKEYTEEIGSYKMHIASERIYHYTWHELADIILEESKQLLNGTDQHVKKSRSELLMYILTNLLKALHPLMPFITEEIWSMLPQQSNKKNLLLIEEWPVK